jgi:hypothetical protein
VRKSDASDDGGGGRAPRAQRRPAVDHCIEDLQCDGVAGHLGGASTASRSADRSSVRSGCVIISHPSDDDDAMLNGLQHGLGTTPTSPS